MTWRWRKRKKILPGVTVNATNKSIGLTIGGKFARISVNSSGKVTVGQSLPGTGLYRTEVIHPKTPNNLPPATPPKQQTGIWENWLIYMFTFLLVFVGLLLLFGIVLLR